MRRNHRFLLAFICLLLTTCLILAFSYSTNKKKQPEEQSTCCKKECVEPDKQVPAELMMESISRQLIIAPTLFH